MKRFKLLFKILKLFIIIVVLSSIGFFIYVKTSPKIIISSANNIVLYDKDNNSFFKGSKSKEWVDLDNISDDLKKATINTEDKNTKLIYFLKGTEPQDTNPTFDEINTKSKES